MSYSELQAVLRYLIRRQPFCPFWIEFASGDRLLVTHPESLEWQSVFVVHRAPDRTQRVFTAAGVCQVIIPTVRPPNPPTT